MFAVLALSFIFWRICMSSATYLFGWSYECVHVKIA